MSFAFGKYDTPIKIFTWVALPDGFGGSIPSKQTLLHTNARAIRNKTTGADSLLITGQVDAMRKVYTFGIMYRENFAPKVGQFIEYRGVEHQIIDVTQAEQRQVREFVITAREIEK
jgi:hypothetical protein